MFPFVGLSGRLSGAALIQGAGAMAFPAILVTGYGSRAVKAPSGSAALQKVAVSGTAKRVVKSSSAAAALKKAVVSGSAAVVTVLDSYDTSFTLYDPMYAGGSTNFSIGQSFTLSGAKTITGCKFSLYKYGSPSGNVTAELYATSGGVPTGSPLATSDGVPTSGIPASFGWIPFSFSTPYSASAATYAIVAKYNAGDSSNCIYINYKAYGSHSGTRVHSYSAGYWTGSSFYDTGFYLYGY